MKENVSIEHGEGNGGQRAIEAVVIEDGIGPVAELFAAGIDEFEYGDGVSVMVIGGEGVVGGGAREEGLPFVNVMGWERSSNSSSSVEMGGKIR